MKVLFLDMDGVLNSDLWLDERKDWVLEKKRQTKVHPWRDVIDPEAVARLNTILEQTGAKVVISSAWRHQNSPEEMRGHLEHHGFKGRIIGQTPARLSNYTRWLEIEWWLNEQQVCPEGIVILDDIKDFGFYTSYRVWTDPTWGLQDTHVEKAVEILNQPFGTEALAQIKAKWKNCSRDVIED